MDDGPWRHPAELEEALVGVADRLADRRAALRDRIPEAVEEQRPGLAVGRRGLHGDRAVRPRQPVHEVELGGVPPGRVEARDVLDHDHRLVLAEACHLVRGIERREVLEQEHETTGAAVDRGVVAAGYAELELRRDLVVEADLAGVEAELVPAVAVDLVRRRQLDDHRLGEIIRGARVHRSEPGQLAQQADPLTERFDAEARDARAGQRASALPGGRPRASGP